MTALDTRVILTCEQVEVPLLTSNFGKEVYRDYILRMLLCVSGRKSAFFYAKNQRRLGLSLNKAAEVISLTGKLLFPKSDLSLKMAK